MSQTPKFLRPVAYDCCCCCCTYVYTKKNAISCDIEKSVESLSCMMDCYVDRALTCG